MSEHTEAAADGPGQAGDRATDRGLARAGFADEAEHLPSPDDEADALPRVEVATAESAGVDDVEVARGYDRLPHLPLACLGGGLTRLGGAGRGLPRRGGTRRTGVRRRRTGSPTRLGGRRLPASCHGRAEARHGRE